MTFDADVFDGDTSERADFPATTTPDSPIVARMLSRVVTRFRTPNRIAWLRKMAEPAAELVEVFVAILNSAGIDGCTGFQLDAIGVVVGQQRQGLTGADYRRYLRARIAANGSTAVVDVIYKVARLVINDPTVTLEIVQDGTAAYTLLVAGSPIGAATQAALAVLVRAATAAGVRVLLQVTTVVDSAVATTALDTVGSGDSIGSGFYTADTTGFPTTGSLVIEAGDISGGKEETVSYTATTPTSFTLSGTLAKTHGAGAIAYLEPSDGRGVGECAQTTPATISVGSATVTVDATTGFPTSGTIEVDGGTDLGETLAYTSRTGTVFTLAAGVTTAFAHLIGAMVVSVDDGGALDDSALI